VATASGATDEVFVPVARNGRKDLLDAGESVAFAWSFDVETYPDTTFTVRFADDHELEWEVGPDLRAKKAAIRDW
jgi:hypothetical protein